MRIVNDWIFDIGDESDLMGIDSAADIYQGENVPLSVSVILPQEDIQLPTIEGEEGEDLSFVDGNNYPIKPEVLDIFSRKFSLDLALTGGSNSELKLRSAFRGEVMARCVQGSGNPGSSNEFIFEAKILYYFSTQRLQGFYRASLIIPLEDEFDFPEDSNQSDNQSDDFTQRIHPQLPKLLRVINNFTSGDSINVALNRTRTDITPELPLWLIILKTAEEISYDKYERFMNFTLCGEVPPEFGNEVFRDDFGKLKRGPGGFGFIKDVSPYQNTYGSIERKVQQGDQDLIKADRFTPHSPIFTVTRILSSGNLGYSKLDAYSRLRAATEAFLIVNCGVDLRRDFIFDDEDVLNAQQRLELTGQISTEILSDLWDKYLEEVNGASEPLIPYFSLIRRKFAELSFNTDENLENELGRCYALLEEKFRFPCFVELIWSYWHEESMLVQSLNAIALRFQNVSRGKGRDPLANMEIDPLRGVNNLLWGYIQDEQHRLTVNRRAMEYDHQYGIRPIGKAIRNQLAADSRSRFIEAFHHLLHLCAQFYLQEDDTTVVADGFPILNGLREIHVILSEGSHNQFGDMPFTARSEMMMMQWILGRPEFREFLPTRNMVAYSEPWMDRVAAMNTLQGWTDVPVNQFRQLAIYGEQILLSIRFGDWARILPHERLQAANWARFWRTQIQGYVHSYRAVTGVDLTKIHPKTGKVDATPPPLLLHRRLSGSGSDKKAIPPLKRVSQSLPPASRSRQLPNGLRARKRLKSGK